MKHKNLEITVNIKITIAQNAVATIVYKVTAPMEAIKKEIEDSFRKNLESLDLKSWKKPTNHYDSPNVQATWKNFESCKSWENITNHYDACIRQCFYAGIIPSYDKRLIGRLTKIKQQLEQIKDVNRRHEARGRYQTLRKNLNGEREKYNEKLNEIHAEFQREASEIRLKYATIKQNAIIKIDKAVSSLGDVIDKFDAAIIDMFEDSLDTSRKPKSSEEQSSTQLSSEANELEEEEDRSKLRDDTSHLSDLPGAGTSHSVLSKIRLPSISGAEETSVKSTKNKSEKYGTTELPKVPGADDITSRGGKTHSKRTKK